MTIIQRALDTHRVLLRKDQEIFERFLAGWRPKLWEEGATDEEKAGAINKYLRGELPLEGLEDV